MNPRIRNSVTTLGALTAGGAAWYKAEEPSEMLITWVAIAAAWVFLFYFRAPAENDREKIKRLEAAIEALHQRMEEDRQQHHQAMATEAAVFQRKLTIAWSLIPEEIKRLADTPKFEDFMNGVGRRKSDDKKNRRGEDRNDKS